MNFFFYEIVEGYFLIFFRYSPILVILNEMVAPQFFYIFQHQLLPFCQEEHHQEQCQHRGHR